MIKLKVNSRFMNAIDGKIYDVGDELITSSQADADYFISHKLASLADEKPVKEIEVSDLVKQKPSKKK